MAGAIAPRGKRRVGAEINVVPYIDVMLVLLVIFMVTAPLLTQGVDVDLPQASGNPLTSEDEPVTLSVDGRGQYFLDVGTNKAAPLSDEDVVARVGAVVRNKPKTTVLLRAEKTVPYDRVANGLALLQAAGVTKLGIVTDVPGAPPSKASRK